MENPSSISVWFVCKLCQCSFQFQEVSRFIQHKKEKHFLEFQKTKAIVFEEKIFDRDTTDGILRAASLPVQEVSTEHQSKPSLKSKAIFSRSQEAQDSTNPNKNYSFDTNSGEVEVGFSTENRSTKKHFDSIKSLDLNSKIQQEPPKIIQSSPLPLSVVIKEEPANFSLITNEERISYDDDASYINYTNEEPVIKLEFETNTNGSGDGIEENLASMNYQNELPPVKTELVTFVIESQNQTQNQAKNSSSLRKSSTKSVFTCHLCGSTVNSITALQYHQATHSDARPFICIRPNCSAAFKLKMSLLRHEREVHSFAKMFKCSQPGCPKSFVSQSYVRKHMQCHSSERQFKCSFDNCGRTFKQLHGLKNHIKTVHSDKRRPYNYSFPCDQCPKVCSSKQNLLDHSMSHEGNKVKSFECTDCAGKFVRHQDLMTHVKKFHFEH